MGRFGFPWNDGLAGTWQRRGSRVLLLLVLLGLFAGWSCARARKEVVIHVDGGVIELATLRTTVAEALAQAGIALAARDRVIPEPAAKLGKTNVLVVTRAVPVRVRVDGFTVAVFSSEPLVRGVLAEAEIPFGDQDIVRPELEAAVESGMTITVVRVVEEVKAERYTVPFRVEKREDSSLEAGTVRIVQEGKKGVRERKVRLRYEDGVLVSREVLDDVVIEEPVREIRLVGTAGTISRGGVTFRYKKALEMVATAYYPGPESVGKWADGYTAIGLKATKGVVAVDPRVIPLRSRLYVEGYGVAIAGDVGGAIKGNRIDVCFDTRGEAIRWGRKRVMVYVLD